MSFRLKQTYSKSAVAQEPPTDEVVGDDNILSDEEVDENDESGKKTTTVAAVAAEAPQKPGIEKGIAMRMTRTGSADQF
jgi:hypothetical protein